MGDVEAQIEQIEININDAKAAIERFNTLERLTNNADFKKIILEGYFKDEAIRLVMIKGDHTFIDEEDQRQIIKSIDAISSLRIYFQTIRQMAMQAQNALNADEETREELLAEAS